MRAASGEVICFLDADDLWEPDYLKALALAYTGDRAPDMVLSNLRRFGAEEGHQHHDVPQRHRQQASDHWEL